jgi:protein TonB
MTSFCSSALASLDDSLALLYESSRKLRAAKLVNTAEVIERLKMAAESARTVRELVWSELPDASWQNREELDALNEKIQGILDARTLEQLRSRLLALATELERGSIVHRRAHRLSELNQLRDQAVNELRSQAGLNPQTLPGPDADQWIEWACSLKEPQDAESLQILRDGFAHLDDFVANVEPSMWIAPGPPTLATPPEPDKSGHEKQAEQSRAQTTRVEEPVVSSTPNLVSKVAFDAKRKEVAGLSSPANPQLSRPQGVVTSSEAPAVQSKGPVLSDVLALPLASLDAPLALLDKNLEKLKAAQSVDIAEVIEQFRLAAESAQIVHQLVLSELPAVSWQNREELDALMEKIQTILDVRTLEQLRARLLALATELESGSIVHRRAHRLSELNQLRDQAVNELRSQASLEGAPQTLPGPEAHQWIEWACGLKEPQDAESLQTLRVGFPHLDDFVANLEPNMWIPAGSPPPAVLPEPERSAGTTASEPSRLETIGSERPAVGSGPIPIELEAARPRGGGDEPRFGDLLGELSLPLLDSNTLTPNDVTPPRTQEEIQRITAQEQALLTSMMGLVTDPAGHFNRPVERPPTAEVFREASVTPAVLMTDRVGQLKPPVESPSTAEVFRKTRAARAVLVSDPVDRLNPPAESSFTAEVFRETSAAPAVPSSDVRTGVEEPSGGKLRSLLANPTVLVLVALLVFGVLGVILWRSYSSRASSSPVQAIVTKTPDQTQGISEVKGSQSGLTTVSETRTSTVKAQNEKQTKPQDQTAPPSPTPKPSPGKQAAERDSVVLRPGMAISRNIAPAENEEGPPNITGEMPAAIPGGLPNAPPSSVANIPASIPVDAPNTAVQKVRVSSGVAQGLLIHQVTPKYPPLARQTRIQGTVVLQAVIGKDGTVQNLHVLSGHPMLTQAAMDAVKQWRYKPYYVNGEPVEADTQINVNFTLSGG